MHDEPESISIITVILNSICENQEQGLYVAAGVPAVQQPAESS